MSPPRMLAACMLALLASIATTAAAAGARAHTGTWHVVLAAGDKAQPVFDNATRAFAARLVEAGVPPGNIRRFSASADAQRSGAEQATKAALLKAVAALPVRAGDRCLVFITSHGTRGEGVYLAAANEMLTPNELAEALSRRCARVPTVAVVSACYSGGFIVGAMPRDNRIVLTAARADRPSFGCQANRTYTFFDGCLLQALPKAATWRALYDDTSACVQKLEQELKETPSEPQASFGAAVRGLRLPHRVAQRRAPAPRPAAPASASAIR
ncbi:MAG TPA: C13 family peptidase [Stellaceae bacterium]|nr:C13 family peptidase [Stellaceae bacterium]